MRTMMIYVACLTGCATTGTEAPKSAIEMIAQKDAELKQKDAELAAARKEAAQHQAAATEFAKTLAERGMVSTDKPAPNPSAPTMPPGAPNMPQPTMPPNPFMLGYPPAGGQVMPVPGAVVHPGFQRIGPAYQGFAGRQFERELPQHRYKIYKSATIHDALNGPIEIQVGEAKLNPMTGDLILPNMVEPNPCRPIPDALPPGMSAPPLRMVNYATGPGCAIVMADARGERSGQRTIRFPIRGPRAEATVILFYQPDPFTPPTEVCRKTLHFTQDIHNEWAALFDPAMIRDCTMSR